MSKYESNLFSLNEAKETTKPIFKTNKDIYKYYFEIFDKECNRIDKEREKEEKKCWSKKGNYDVMVRDVKRKYITMKSDAMEEFMENVKRESIEHGVKPYDPKDLFVGEGSNSYTKIEVIKYYYTGKEFIPYTKKNLIANPI